MDRFLFKNKHTLMMLSALLAAVLLLSMLACGVQINAWFRAHLMIKNPAQLTNFVTGVHYSFDGSNWESLDPGDPIEITPDRLNTLQIKPTFQGESAAYLRVTVYGSFYNQHTGTFLPQPQDFWSITADVDAKWEQDGEYLYYTERLKDYPTETELDAFTVSAQWDGIDRSAYQEYSGELYVLVDAVQSDRYTAFWGIEQLPF